MNKKGKLLGIIFCLFMSILIFGIGFVDKDNTKDTVTLFQVHLNGKKIGLIKDDQELYDLIDKEQTSIKEKYGVKKVHPPHGLKLTAIKTYLKEPEIVDVLKIQPPKF